jgi:hypothetical protein
VSTSHDFWISSGHHLLDRDREGRVVVSDDFLKVYLARPEITPPVDACIAEQSLHRKLLDDPRAGVAPTEVSAIADSDARENWETLLAWRDHLVQYPTLEAAYLALVREGLRFPPLFIDQMVQAILRNVLDDCDDVFVLRAAELFFRPQKLTLHEGALLAGDSETFPQTPRVTPLVSLLGLKTQPDIEVLDPESPHAYWERSDSFDLGLDLTVGRRGNTALGEVVARWVHHLLGLEVEIESLREVRDVTLTWYVGLDSHATRLGDALWSGKQTAGADSEFIVALYRLKFVDESAVLEQVRGEPTYLLIAASNDMTLRLKPQNLITGLPLRPASEVAS